MSFICVRVFLAMNYQSLLCCLLLGVSYYYGPIIANTSKAESINGCLFYSIKCFLKLSTVHTHNPLLNMHNGKMHTNALLLDFSGSHHFILHKAYIVRKIFPPLGTFLWFSCFL